MWTFCKSVFANYGEKNWHSLPDIACEIFHMISKCRLPPIDPPLFAVLAVNIDFFAIKYVP